MPTIKKTIDEFLCMYQNLRKDDNGRYLSWEHCYSAFYTARKDSQRDIDKLSLHLAFYLASWGMYRGSSFLLQQDYKIHNKAIGILLDEKYDSLVGINCKDYNILENQDKLTKLSNKIKAHYNPIRSEIKNTKLNTGVTDTLLTKILMGTMGCVPAYDKYFIAGLKRGVDDGAVAIRTYNNKSIQQLVAFYSKYNEQLESLREKMTISNAAYEYPQMKLLDMLFWQIGFNSINKGKKQSH